MTIFERQRRVAPSSPPSPTLRILTGLLRIPCAASAMLDLERQHPVYALIDFIH